MLQLKVGSAADKLREELKSWLQKNPPPKVGRDCSLDNFISVGKSWQQKLASGKWIAVHWPQEFGGRGLSLVEEAIIQEELSRAGAPQLLGLFGLSMVGPVLIRHGTAEHRKKFLSPILSAEHVWCQGFSETQAGSDLAAVSTSAEPITGADGTQGFRVRGHKIWTSFGHVADWCFLLARSFRADKPHEGLTYLLVDMKSPGISVRPLVQITGESEFNEVYFDDVFVPEENVVGKVGDGWRIAIATLMHERVILTFSRHLQTELPLRGLLDRQKSESLPGHLLRSLAKEAAHFCATRALAYSHLVKYDRGEEPGAEGSLDKLYWSESFQRVADLVLQAEGRQAVAVPRDQDEKLSPACERYLYSRGRTIAAGTSEIQRMIIAQRLLGLPR